MMLPFKNLCRIRNVLRYTQERFRKTSTDPVKLDEKINTDLENENYKPKDHAGRVRASIVQLPYYVVDAIEAAVPEKQVSRFIEDGASLDRYLFARHIPLEQKEIFSARKEIQKNILQKEGVKHLSELDSSDNAADAKRNIAYEVSRIYYKTNYNWKPIIFDSHKAWCYLFGRATKEYAVILKIFKEIAIRDPNFTPRSFFDFGSGVGTGTWAAAELWRKSLYEYVSIDQSAPMNDLAELILRDGNENKNMTLKNVFYRQFLPASDEMKSHIVLSAFSLMEIPNMEQRLETLLTLWKKCDGYMVIVENGTNAGFKLINEAREFLLQHTKSGDEAYLFAPCPHEADCSRVLANDKTPCSFVVSYRPLRIGAKERDGKMLFSYLIFKKGSRSHDNSINWPRMVRPTQVRSGHVRCQLCTHRGNLEELIITKGKNSKYTYRCARKSEWGDRMPIEFIENADTLDSKLIKSPDDDKS